MHATIRKAVVIPVIAAAAAAGLAGSAQAYPAGVFAQPDMVISSIESGSLSYVTVKNAGQRAAGNSQLKVGIRTYNLAPFQAGESRRIAVGNLCEGWVTATADSLNQVPESNEYNNSRTVQVLC